MALGVLISFRILNFPDLTADGSFPLGGAVAAIMIAGGQSPWLACAAAMLAGAAAGWVTAWLNVRLNILQLLASILVMIALYSINLRVMGAPNVALIGSPTVFSPLIGDAFRARHVGAAGRAGRHRGGRQSYCWTLILPRNPAWPCAPPAPTAHGARPGDFHQPRILTGMALSNALIALGGALYVQTPGQGGYFHGRGHHCGRSGGGDHRRTLIPSRSLWVITLATVLGAICTACSSPWR